MEYRTLGESGLEVSAMGLGTEHLIREVEAMDAVLGAAVDAGVNYADLVWAEPDYWDFFGPAVRPYRGKLILAAHWGCGPHYNVRYCQRTFEDVLSRLGNDYAEVGMLAMVDTEHKWDTWVPESVERMQQYKEQGRIGCIGMTTHVASMAVKAANSGLIDVLMYPLNMTSHFTEQSSRVIQTCVENGIGLVAMKPYGGGMLFSAGGKPSGITPTQCLSYVLSLPVSTTVPGVKQVQELETTLHYLGASDEEREYDSVLETVRDSLVGVCTSCEHCLPCPQSIDISKTIHLVDWAEWALGDTDEGAEVLAVYAALPVKASACSECGVCMERCPFGVDVTAKMRKAAEVLEPEVTQ